MAVRIHMFQGKVPLSGDKNDNKLIILSIYVMIPYHGIISGKLIVVPELDILRK